MASERTGLIAFIRGRLPGPSEEAQRGRKEILWIAASVRSRQARPLTLS